MKTHLILITAGLATLVSCDQKQGIQQMLQQSQRTQSQELNKLAQDLTAKITSLEAQNLQIQQSLSRATDDPISREKIADEIGTNVLKKTDEKLTNALNEVKAKLDSLEKAIKDIKVAAASAPAPQPVAQAPAPAPQQQFTPPAQAPQQPSGNSGVRVSGQGQSDPNRKRYKFDF